MLYLRMDESVTSPVMNSGILVGLSFPVAKVFLDESA